MTLNVCINQGYLGSLSITPSSYSSELSSSSVNYTLKINYLNPLNRIENPVDISGEVNISSSNSLQTGIFDFQFTQQQTTKYSISKKENGFSFIIDNQTIGSFNNTPLSFTLRILNFYDSYTGSLVIDTYSQEYGSIISPINIEPPIEQSLINTEGADEENTDNLGGGDNSVILPELVKLGEYNFYLKEYEETELLEKDLLNINANYSSKQIQDYFKLIYENEYSSRFFIHSSDYVKELYPKFDKQKFFFPMYVENKFATDNTKTQLTTLLKKLGLLDYFCSYLINFGFQKPNIFEYINLLKNDTILFTNFFYTGDMSNIDSYKTFNFQKIILFSLLQKEILNPDYISYYKPDTGINLSDNPESEGGFLRVESSLSSINLSDNPESEGGFLRVESSLSSINLSDNPESEGGFLRFESSLSSINLSDNPESEGGFLRFETNEMSALKSFYDNQILMYKVSKFKLNDLQNAINHQYFINIFENEELTYFDTQIKYDTSYQYRFYKIEIVNGIILETEIQNYRIENIKIVDSPPLPPDVVYVPYKGIDDKILINFNASSGKYIDYPIPIKTSDITIFNNIIQHSSYNLSLKEQRKIQFETDDDYGTFELYRLDTAPKSYTDFDNAALIETTSNSIEDYIEPNKKYYYVARVKDIHGNISNPTKPIEIQMINENGTIFLLKREYMFEEENKVFSKKMKTLLQIKLDPEQTAIDQVSTLGRSPPNPRSANDVIDNLVLSTKETKIWGKQFLMRVTSKNTGKKIDVKFRFSTG